jgi:hypothetical protein
VNAQILARHALVYADAPQLDRPPHVRAGSTLLHIDQQLLIFQDDCLWLAVVDLPSLRVTALPLPAENDVRVFDHAHKAQKPDLEAAFALHRDGKWLVIALGSGSTRLRRRWLVIDDWLGGRTMRWVDATALYVMLAARTDFCGSELNIEGAAVSGDKLVLLQRGNGAPQFGLQPIDTTGELPMDAVLAWLLDPQQPLPDLQNVRQRHPGTIDGVRLTLTDAVGLDDRTLLAVAAAEASPDTFADGRVFGAALGLLSQERELWAILTEDGARFIGKPEGIALDRDVPGQGWLVLDADDPERPSELCRFCWQT